MSERSLARRAGPLVIALFVAQLATALIPFGLGVLSPVIRDRFELSRAEVGMGSTAIFVAVALLSVPMGRTADRLGVARTLAISSGTIGLAVVASGFAASYLLFLACLVVVGIGYAAVTPTTNKGVLAAATPRMRGQAMGIKQMGVTAGGVVAAALLPGAIERSGWRATLVVTGVAVATAGWLAAFTYSRLARGRPPREADGTTATSLGRLLRLGAIVGVLVAAQGVVGTYLALFLVDRRGADLKAAALALTVLHASGTVARFGWGWVSDRLAGGRLRTLWLIGFCAAGGAALLAAVGASIPTPGLIVLIVFLGVATQGGNAVYQAALAEQDEERAGRASGIGMSIGFTGAVIGPPVFGAAVDAWGYEAPLLGVALIVAGAASAVLRLVPRSPARAYSGV